VMQGLVMWLLLQQRILGNLALDFNRCDSNTFTLNTAWDNLRCRLMLLSPGLFKWGEMTSLDYLLRYLLETPLSTLESCLICTEQHLVGVGAQIASNCCVLSAGTISYSSIGYWASNLRESTQHTCPLCSGPVHMKFNFCQPWPLIAFEFAWQHPEIDVHLEVNVNGVNVQYILSGVVYFGHEHFTCWIISSDAGLVWFHDGITTGSKSVINEGRVDTIGSLSTCRGKQAAVAIYASMMGNINESFKIRSNNLFFLNCQFSTVMLL
jgi:hypothetical protein